MAAPLRDRLSFLSRLPVLLRATADDDVPCPGYLLEEIASMGSSPGPCGSLQGFGFSGEKSGSGKFCPRLVLPLTPCGSPALYCPACTL
ncbi:ap-4 complex accessory subunit tepsin [Limosa lapponica baueri]|uniref:Ap-4 complex accessory subunit tepsin n=1 Tax=Limosa lapponica baueri TaxID=1758121 RepID=A0A2I0TDA4_LIMLA|nr:ap-4 complex accessory subunit tepsin [Limosa lapponica baueri]